MPEELEDVKKCNNITDLRRIAENKPELMDASSDSISPVKILLSDVFCRLELKSKKFQVLGSATPAEIEDFWTVLLSTDDTLRFASDTYTKKTVAIIHLESRNVVHSPVQSASLLVCLQMSLHLCTTYLTLFWVLMVIFFLSEKCLVRLRQKNTDPP